MSFAEVDREKTDAYKAQSEALWGGTAAFREYEEKSKGRSADAEDALAAGLTAIFADFGKCKNADPASPEAQALTQRLQRYITAHYYRCTPEILRGLGEMYGAGGAFTENIDKAGGAGTAAFASRAVALYCQQN